MFNTRLECYCSPLRVSLIFNRCPSPHGQELCLKGPRALERYAGSAALCHITWPGYDKVMNRVTADTDGCAEAGVNMKKSGPRFPKNDMPALIPFVRGQR